MWPGLTEKLIKKYLEKSRNTTMVHLHIRRQGLKSTKERPPDTDLEDKIKPNVVLCTTVYPSTTKDENIYSDLCILFPTTSSRWEKYIYVMYVYDFNYILTAAMNNRSYTEMIISFPSFTEHLKIRGISPGFHFMDNEAYTNLKMTMTSMNIKYQLVPPSNQISDNLEREIQTFKNHFIAGM